MFKNYYRTREWLESFIPQTYSEKNLGLARIKHLLKLLGNPQGKFKSIHVAGTSGKGSTAFYIAKLLQSQEKSETQRVRNSDKSENLKYRNSEFSEYSDLKVALHISPHLSYIGERMQINGKPISVDRLITLINEIKPHVESMGKLDIGLSSYFEILTAASFLYFAQEKVDWAVVEVGLGGRLDATNVLKPQISVITNIGLDHTEILGKSIEKIAKEKAGIIKKNTPVVTAATGKTLKVIEKVAGEKKSPLITIHTQSSKKTLSSDIQSYIKEYYEMLNNSHQNFAYQNLVLALVTLISLKINLTKETVSSVSKMKFPGRFEQIEEGIILDGAHNPDKVKFMVRWLKNSERLIVNSRLTLVLAFKKSKNWQKMVDLLIKNLPVKKVIATQFNTPTDTGFFSSVQPQDIKEFVTKKYSVNCSVVANSQEAVFASLNANSLEANQLVLVTGSLYLVGEVRTLWYLPQF